MEKAVIQSQIPPELVARAPSFVEEGWASNLDELLVESLRRFIESHSSRITESFVMSDVQWGLTGNDWKCPPHWSVAMQDGSL